MTTPPLPPPLKWAGGKRWQVPHLRPTWETHAERRLVEPFSGGLAVALTLQPTRALLADVNPHLVNFYACLKRGLVIDLPMENQERAYYRHRKHFNDLITEGMAFSAEGASLFYYLNRTGYNGLCRFNRSGHFNVPFGRYARIRYTRDFGTYAEVFAPWTFAHLDFESIPLEPDDFVYADPPYDVPFTSYARGGFKWTDQERAARFFAAHPGPVVLVNQATPRIETLYRSLGYDIKFVRAPRRISCTGDRTPAREIIGTKNI